MSAAENLPDDDAPNSKAEIPASKSKADRALAVMHSLTPMRGPAGIVVVVGDRVIAVPSRECDEAFRSEWCEHFPGETIGPATIARAVASVRADKSLPQTDRKPPPKPTAQRPDDDRPTIVIDTDVETMTSRTIAALANDRRNFQRGGQLVIVTNAEPLPKDDDEKRKGARFATGSPMVRAMSLPTLNERAATAVRFVKVNADGDERPELPPPSVITAVHNRGEWPGVLELAGVIETPTMRPNGTLIQKPGYDRETGFLYSPNATFPIIPDRPTQAHAREALAELQDIWVDFPFVGENDGGSSRMVPVAALLTVLVRPAIVGPVPAFVVDASTRSSGKSLVVQLVVEIGTGRPPALATFPTGRDGGAELEKMLASYALAGALVVPFDNISIGTTFGGAALEKYITAGGKVSLRKLGQSEAPEVPWNGVIFGTGNNLLIGDETARRVLSGRLVSPLERPEERTDFKYPRVVEHVRAMRPRLVAAGLTIVRGYVAANRPDTKTLVLGSFEAWSELVPRAIVWAGGHDVMGARVTGAADADEATMNLATVLALLPALLKEQPKGLTANGILDALYPGPKPHDPPDGYGELRSALESATGARPGTRPESAKLGTYFRGHRDRKIDGKRLVVLGTSARANRWGVQ